MARALINVGLALALLCATRVNAAPATLAWCANSETNVVGYRVYLGAASRAYDTVVDVGNVTEYPRDYAVGLHYLAVTAYDTDGLESEFSDELALLIVEPPTPRFESNALTWEGVGAWQVRWATDTTTNSQIFVTNRVALGVFPRGCVLTVRQFQPGASNVWSAYSAALFYNPPEMVSEMRLRVVVQRTRELGQPFADFTEASFFDEATNQAFYRARLEIMRSGLRLR